MRIQSKVAVACFLIGIGMVFWALSIGDSEYEQQQESLLDP